MKLKEINLPEGIEVLLMDLNKNTYGDCPDERGYFSVKGGFIPYEIMGNLEVHHISYYPASNYLGIPLREQIQVYMVWTGKEEKE